MDPSWRGREHRLSRYEASSSSSSGSSSSGSSSSGVLEIHRREKEEGREGKQVKHVDVERQQAQEPVKQSVSDVSLSQTSLDRELLPPSTRKTAILRNSSIRRDESQWPVSEITVQQGQALEQG